MQQKIMKMDTLTIALSITSHIQGLIRLGCVFLVLLVASNGYARAEIKNFNLQKCGSLECVEILSKLAFVNPNLTFYYSYDGEFRITNKATKAVEIIQAEKIHFDDLSHRVYIENILNNELGTSAVYNLETEKLHWIRSR